MSRKYSTVEIDYNQEYSINEVRLAFSNLNDMLEEILPKSRAKSIALTNLEQSCMWAVKSISHGDE